MVRQGIAENPASINAKTNARFGDRWQVGEGVFALREAELAALRLDRDEQALVRPYYDLGDVARYWIAERPSLRLIYSTKRDLSRHRPPSAAQSRTSNGFARSWTSRRETRRGSNSLVAPALAPRRGHLAVAQDPLSPVCRGGRRWWPFRGRRTSRSA